MRQRKIQSSDFFKYSWLLLPKPKWLIGASRIRCGESGTPSINCYTMNHSTWVTRVSCSYGYENWPPVDYYHHFVIYYNIDLSPVYAVWLNSRDQWDLTQFSKGHCTNQMAGYFPAVGLGLCKETVVESTRLLSKYREQQTKGPLWTESH